MVVSHFMVVFILWRGLLGHRWETILVPGLHDIHIFVLPPCPSIVAAADIPLIIPPHCAFCTPVVLVCSFHSAATGGTAFRAGSSTRFQPLQTAAAGSSHFTGLGPQKLHVCRSLQGWPWPRCSRSLYFLYTALEPHGDSRSHIKNRHHACVCKYT